MVEPENTENRHLKEILETGSGVAGSVAGTAIGLIMGGPSGAFAGAVGGPLAGRTTFYLASEFKHRVLGQREEERIGGTMAFAIEKIQENISEGKQFREDGFFEDQPTQRASAKEVFEGLLLAAQREHEEKKLLFYGNLLANLAFESSIDREYASHLTKEAQSLSYRQLCVLAFIGVWSVHRRGINRRLRDPYLGSKSVPDLEVFKRKKAVLTDDQRVSRDINSQLLGRETFDLITRGLISTSQVSNESNYRLDMLSPSSIGSNLWELMELWNANQEDMEKVGLFFW